MAVMLRGSRGKGAAPQAARTFLAWFVFRSLPADLPGIVSGKLSLAPVYSLSGTGFESVVFPLSNAFLSSQGART